MIDRLGCEAVFRAAVAACDPEQRVRWTLAANPPQGRFVFGLAIGKAAQAMARGAGPVFHGVCVTHSLDGMAMPKGWYVIEAAHPIPDERSLAAGDAVCDLVASATAEDVVIALISGGASALVERPVAGLSIEQFVREIQTLAETGADIHALNAARTARSQLKGGKLAELSAAPVRTLVASDVVDDDVRVVGSGPTCTRRLGDTCTLAIPIRSFVQAIEVELRHHVTWIDVRRDPLVAPVATCADELLAGLDGDATRIAWGEPVLPLPAERGEGGRAQQLALELARRIRATDRFAFVAGSDGQDGPKPFGRPAPAGAFVDGTTWDRIADHLDPAAALARCDAGTALDRVGALVITQATGINHGDVVILGRSPVDAIRTAG
ncbi:MAG: DUF4147 domain-containing protein [Kofleriaceae bacterium]